jgi:hypothetical protein
MYLFPIDPSFYSSDRDEPEHVHVERGDSTAKFWLRPVRLQTPGGFRRSELRRIQRLIEQHRERLRWSWNEYFGK